MRSDNHAYYILFGHNIRCAIILASCQLQNSSSYREGSENLVPTTKRTLCHRHCIKKKARMAPSARCPRPLRIQRNVIAVDGLFQTDLKLLDCDAGRFIEGRFTTESRAELVTDGLRSRFRSPLPVRVVGDTHFNSQPGFSALAATLDNHSHPLPFQDAGIGL